MRNRVLWGNGLIARNRELKLNIESYYNVDLPFNIVNTLCCTNRFSSYSELRTRFIGINLDLRHDVIRTHSVLWGIGLIAGNNRLKPNIIRYFNVGSIFTMDNSLCCTYLFASVFLLS